jgi:hypothetical protein
LYGRLYEADADSSHRRDAQDCVLQIIKRRILIHDRGPQPATAQWTILVVPHEMPELLQWNACPVGTIRILARHDDGMNIFDLHVASSKNKNRRLDE